MTNPDLSPRAAALHADALVWDSHAGFEYDPSVDLGQLERWRNAGVDFLSPNVAYDVRPWETTLAAISSFRRWILTRPERYRLAQTVADVRTAKKEGCLALAYDMPGSSLESTFRENPRFWPDHQYPAEIEEGLVDPERLPVLTDALLARGYSDAEVRGVLGENFMRVAEAVWR